jgi:hypothetical protein
MTPDMAQILGIHRWPKQCGCHAKPRMMPIRTQSGWYQIMHPRHHAGAGDFGLSVQTWKEAKEYATRWAEEEDAGVTRCGL